ncbi:MAG: hypothetical protein ABJM43_00090 [Paracoccaceae bacterium]
MSKISLRFPYLIYLSIASILIGVVLALDLSRFSAAPIARLGHFPFESDWAFPTQR